jgi:proteasome lid subunit RPN8/RPN11
MKKRHRLQDNLKKTPQTIDEDLESINEAELLREDVKQTHPAFKKIFIIISALTIAFLFLSLTYLQYPLFNVIQGRIESRSPNNNVLELKDFNIVFSDSAMNSLSASFSVNQEVETVRCLKGNIEGNNYYITEVYTPRIYEQSFRHVSSEPCSDDTLIMFHTHPYRSCVASDTDLVTLKANQERNPNLIMIIMCEPDRFSTYR